jgi:hypothetical protein
VFNRNLDFESLNVTLNTCIRSDEATKEQNIVAYLTKEQTQAENDKCCKEFEVFVQGLKLGLLNKMKTSTKVPIHPKKK